MVHFNDDMKVSGFELMPSGTTILRVKEVKGITAQGKVTKYKITFEDKQGRCVFNDYNVSPASSYYKQAMRAFYGMLTKGCGLSEINGDINEKEAEGKYLVARILHNEANNGNTYANLGWIVGHVESFDDDITPFLTDEELDALVDVDIVDNAYDDDPFAC